jgi:hypothetical protein
MPNRNSQAMGRIDRQREPASEAVDPPKGHQLIDKSPQFSVGDGGGPRPPPMLQGRPSTPSGAQPRHRLGLAPRPTGPPRRFFQVPLNIWTASACLRQNKCVRYNYHYIDTHLTQLFKHS